MCVNKSEYLLSPHAMTKYNWDNVCTNNQLNVCKSAILKQEEIIFFKNIFSNSNFYREILILKYFRAVVLLLVASTYL